MNFEASAKTKELQQRLQKFMDAHVYPNEKRFEKETALEPWKPTQIVEELKVKARGERIVEFVFAGGSGRSGPEQSGVRTAMRNHGPQPYGGGGF